MVQLTPNLGLIKPELTDSMPDWADQNEDNCNTLDGIIVSTEDTFTPSLTATTTNPTLGNTLLEGKYITLWPNLVIFWIRLRILTGWSAGNGNYRLSLPFTADSTYNDFLSGATGRGAIIGKAIFLDDTSNANCQNATVGMVSLDTVQLNLESGNAIWSTDPDRPFTLAGNDNISLYGVYLR